MTGSGGPENPPRSPGEGASEPSWRPLLSADRVPAGAVTEVEVDGRELVVWRTTDGRPVVMDARCPHQWSHLGTEGAVDGDELVCLSHFWRFDAAGRGTKVNVRGRRDEKADIPTFAARQRDGVIEARLGGDPSGGSRHSGPPDPSGG